MICDEKITFSNGVSIPRLGLGVWMIPNANTAEAVKAAVAMGYRHIDTAQAYGNEQGVGEGVRSCGVPREEIFVTSKIAAECKSYKSAMDSLDQSLARMGMDYVDMMIIHSPQPWNEVNQTDNRYLEENRQVWKALEDAYKAGKVKAIGVSNFLQGDIDNLIASCEIKPMVNQILVHIANTPFELIDYCKDKGIEVEAYSPIAHGIALRNEKIAAMAQKYGVSIAQLCVRYDWQLGFIVLPKTANPDHMKNNMDINFEISPEDMETLKNMEKIQSYEEFGGFPCYGGKWTN